MPVIICSVEVTADFPHTSGMFRKLAAYALALFAASLFPQGAYPKAPDTLVAGMELAYPPFEMADERGQPAGVSVDLANALGGLLHKKVEIQNLPLDGLIPSLRTGRIDLIISSM